MGKVILLVLSAGVAGLVSAEDTWSSARAERLLTRWCDALVAYQVPEHPDVRVKGSIVCPACASLHGRVCDLVYPLTYLWIRSGDERHLRAAQAAFDWTEATLVREDGGVYNDYRSAWWGTTVFAQIALGKTLVLWGERLPPDVRTRWTAAFRRETDFLVTRFSDDGFLARINVNYPAAYCEAMRLAARVLGNERYRDEARRMASRLSRQILPDGLLMGEGHPMDARTSRGRAFVDLGYNLEETLPALLAYAEAEGDRPLEAAVVRSACAHLQFLLPDGGLDNSAGSRAAKWTYYGSRTSDGMVGLLAGLARRQVPWAVRALDRHLALLERCTLANGLLAGGLHHAEADEPPCIHHAFAHAKALTDLLVAGGVPVSAPSAALPREAATGLTEVASMGLALVSAGDWRATFSTADAFMGPDQVSVSGGSPSLAWHAATGPLVVGSMAKFHFVEEHNMQDLRHEREVLTTSPHFAVGKFLSCADRKAEAKNAFADGVFTSSVCGRLDDMKGHRGAAYEMTWRLASDGLRCEGRCEAAGRFIFPVVATGREAVRLSSDGMTVDKPGAVVRVKANRSVRLLTTDRGERAFNPVAGVMTAQLCMDVPAGETFVLTLGVEPKRGTR